MQNPFCAFGHYGGVAYQHRPEEKLILESLSKIPPTIVQAPCQFGKTSLFFYLYRIKRALWIDLQEFYGALEQSNFPKVINDCIAEEAKGAKLSLKEKQIILIDEAQAAFFSKPGLKFLETLKHSPHKWILAANQPIPEHIIKWCEVIELTELPFENIDRMVGFLYPHQDETRKKLVEQVFVWAGGSPHLTQ